MEEKLLTGIICFCKDIKKAVTRVVTAFLYAVDQIGLEPMTSRL